MGEKEGLYTVGTDLDQMYFVMRTKRLNQFNILGLCVCLDKNTHMGLTFIEGLCTLAQSTGEAVVLEGDLEDFLECFFNGEFTTDCWGGGGFFFLRGFVYRDFISSVRHPERRECVSIFVEILFTYYVRFVLYKVEFFLSRMSSFAIVDGSLVCLFASVLDKVE